MNFIEALQKCYNGFKVRREKQMTLGMPSCLKSYPRKILEELADLEKLDHIKLSSELLEMLDQEIKTREKVIENTLNIKQITLTKAYAKNGLGDSSAKLGAEVHLS